MKTITENIQYSLKHSLHHYTGMPIGGFIFIAVICQCGVMWYADVTEIGLPSMHFLKKQEDLKWQNNLNIKYIHVNVKCSELTLRLLQITIPQKYETSLEMHYFKYCPEVHAQAGAHHWVKLRKEFPPVLTVNYVSAF